MLYGKCSLCGELLKIDANTIENGISDAFIINGNVIRFVASYGSKFDGNEYVLIICDACLEHDIEPIKETQYQ